MGLDYLPMALFDTLPRLYAEMRDSFHEVYGLDLREARSCLALSISVRGLAAIAMAIPLSPRNAPVTLSQMARNVIHRPLHRKSGRLPNGISSSVRQVGHLRAFRQRCETTNALRTLIRARAGSPRPSSIADFSSLSWSPLAEHSRKALRPTRPTTTPSEFASDLALRREPPRKSRRTLGGAGDRPAAA